MVIILTACSVLFSGPVEARQHKPCREFQLAMAEEVVLGPMACMMGGQVVIAKWFEEHQSFHVNKWQCLKEKPENL